MMKPHLVRQRASEACKQFYMSQANYSIIPTLNSCKITYIVITIEVRSSFFSTMVYDKVTSALFEEGERERGRTRAGEQLHFLPRLHF